MVILRKTAIALLAVASIGLVWVSPTMALARGGGGFGSGGGGFHGGGIAGGFHGGGMASGFHDGHLPV